MKRISGQTIFELLAMLGIFALVFFPAHFVANRVGLIPGFFLGFVICMAIAYAWARSSGRGEVDMKQVAEDQKAKQQNESPSAEPKEPQ